MRNGEIVVRGLRKTYAPTRHVGEVMQILLTGQPSTRGGHKALADVDLHLEPGGSLGVIGRNGSGKSTLLRILTGVLEPSAGSVRVRGRVAGLLDLGAGIDPEFSGRENAELLGILAGASRRAIRTRIEDVKSFSGLGDAFEEPVRSYSSGMVLRLAFSTAVHSEPDLLLIDEVLAVGDAFFQQRCLMRIRELQQKGCGIVLVSHDLSAVVGFCESALWLEHGRVVCAGEPAKVVREYLGARYRDGATLEDDAFTRAPDAREDLALDANLEPAREIPNIDHRYGDGRARIEGIALRDAGGLPLVTPRPGETLRVVVTVRAEEDVRSPVVGFTLRNRLGEIISATNTNHEDRELPSLSGGTRATVEFAVRWPSFASGTFSFSPAVAEGTLERHAMLDWIDNAIVIETSNLNARYGWLSLEDVEIRCAIDEGDRVG